MTEQEHDRWYFGFRCVNCNALVPIAEDPSKGQTKITFRTKGEQGGAYLNIPCPACGYRVNYPIEQCTSIRSD